MQTAKRISKYLGGNMAAAIGVLITGLAMLFIGVFILYKINDATGAINNTSAPAIIIMR